MSAGAGAVVSRKQRDEMRYGMEAPKDERERAQRKIQRGKKKRKMHLLICNTFTYTYIYIDTKISRVATTMVLILSSLE